MGIDWIQPAVTIAGAVIGSGLIQFLVTRKDKKADEIKALQQKLDEGLEAREATGKERYEEHKEAIAKLNEAIIQLTKNDTDQSTYMKTIGSSLIGLSHDKIISLSDKFLERGGITLKEKGTLNSVYEPYRELGGNGDCHVAYTEVCKLPVIPEDKAKELDRAIANQYLNR